MTFEKEELLIAVKRHAAGLHGCEPDRLRITGTDFLPKMETGGRIINDKRVGGNGGRIAKREFDRLSGVHREVLRAIGIAVHGNGRVLNTLLVQADRTPVRQCQIPTQEKQRGQETHRFYEPIPPHILG